MIVTIACFHVEVEGPLANWLLWWRVDPAEQRAGSLVTSRWFGVCLAALTAAMSGFAAYRCLPYGPSLSIDPGFSLAGSLLLTFAVGWVVLAGFLLRGHRAAIPWLMALSTIEALSVGVMSLTVAWYYWVYSFTHL